MIDVLVFWTWLENLSDDRLGVERFYTNKQTKIIKNKEMLATLES